MSSAPGWPASLVSGSVGVRPFRLRDAQAWSDCRTRNKEWLAPWDGRRPDLPIVSWEDRHTPAAFAATLRIMRRDSRAGRSLPFAVLQNGRLVGEVTVANLVRGAFQSATVGYWVDSAVAGQGVIPTALALVVDHCFTAVGLHRIEANIRPENGPSLAVVRKLGFRDEGLQPRYLFIDGAWRDHRSFALTVEDVPEGLLSRVARHTV